MACGRWLLPKEGASSWDRIRVTRERSRQQGEVPKTQALLSSALTSFSEDTKPFAPLAHCPLSLVQGQPEQDGAVGTEGVEAHGDLRSRKAMHDWHWLRCPTKESEHMSQGGTSRSSEAPRPSEDSLSSLELCVQQPQLLPTLAGEPPCPVKNTPTFPPEAEGELV